MKGLGLGGVPETLRVEENPQGWGVGSDVVNFRLRQVVGRCFRNIEDVEKTH